MGQEQSCGRFRILRKGEDSTCVKVEADVRRHLSQNEITLAKTIFKESIPYELVYICNGGLFNDLTGNARTIGYEITIPSEDYKVGDFSKRDKNFQVWIIHELAHIWQNVLGGKKFTLKEGACLFNHMEYIGSRCVQNGIPVNKPPAYSYNILTDKKDFPNYSFEQQAEIIAHYYEIIHFRKNAKFFSYEKEYEKVLKVFINNPKDIDLLPKSASFFDCILQ